MKMFSMEPYLKGGLSPFVGQGGRSLRFSSTPGFESDLTRYLNPANLSTRSTWHEMSHERWFTLDASRVNAGSEWYQLREQDKGDAVTPQVLQSDETSKQEPWYAWQKPLEDAEQPFQDIVQEASRKFGVPVALVNAVIKQESACNPKAKSHAGAMGLMQLMPGTAKQYGCSDPYDPGQNVMAGTAFLGHLLKKYDGNVELALAGYNAGPGNVKKYGNTIPPFKETINYVKKVTKYYQANLGMSESNAGKFG